MGRVKGEKKKDKNQQSIKILRKIIDKHRFKSNKKQLKRLTSGEKKGKIFYLVWVHYKAL